jgi:hypothetical protein
MAHLVLQLELSTLAKQRRQNLFIGCAFLREGEQLQQKV